MKRSLVGAVRLLDSNKLAVSPCSTFQKFISSFDVPRRTRAGTREFPPGKSREFPENFQSRLVPGIFSISREISGNFYVL